MHFNSLVMVGVSIVASVVNAQDARPATHDESITGFTTSWLGERYNRSIPDGEFLGPIVLADKPDPALQPATLTVEVWYKTPATRQTGAIMFLELYPPTTYSSPFAAVWFRLNTFNRNASGLAPVFSVANGGRYNNFVPSSGVGSIESNLNADTWYHLVATSDDKEARIYVNGVLGGRMQVSGPIMYGPTGARIAGIRNASGSGHPAIEFERMPGTLRLVKLYNRALTESEIALRYSFGVPAVSPSAQGRVADESSKRPAYTGVPSTGQDRKSSDSGILLEEMITKGSAAVHKEIRSTPAASFKSGGSLVGTISWTSDQADASAFVSQQDETFTHPMAAKGDTLFLFDQKFKPIGRTVILARRAFETSASEAACGAQFDFERGWAYLVDPRGIPRTDFGDASLLAFRQVPLHSRLEEATAAETMLARPGIKRIVDSAYTSGLKSMKPSSDEARSFKRMIYGEAGQSSITSQKFYVVRGPAGVRMLVTALIVNDDVKDFGNNTQALIILDSTGKVISRHNGRYNLLSIGDIDGDGVDEVITDEGIAAWVSGKWVIPASPPPSIC